MVLVYIEEYLLCSMLWCGKLKCWGELLASLVEGKMEEACSFRSRRGRHVKLESRRKTRFLLRMRGWKDSGEGGLPVWAVGT